MNSFHRRWRSTFNVFQTTFVRCLLPYRIFRLLNFCERETWFITRGSQREMKELRVMINIIKIGLTIIFHFSRLLYTNWLSCKSIKQRVFHYFLTLLWILLHNRFNWNSFFVIVLTFMKALIGSTFTPSSPHCLKLLRVIQLVLSKWEYKFAWPINEIMTVHDYRWEDTIKKKVYCLIATAGATVCYHFWTK